MTKNKSNDIKKIYSDSLYWAMSPKSKGKPYHLTRVDESILRKLIHYDKTDKKIRYSNDLISQHTFLDVTQIAKSIPRLDKMGYIKTVLITSKDDSGNPIRRRIVNINWDFIESVLKDISRNEIIEPAEDAVNKPISTNEPIAVDMQNDEFDIEDNTADSNEITNDGSFSDDSHNTSDDRDATGPFIQYLNEEIIDIQELMTILEFNEADISKFKNQWFEYDNVSFKQFRHKLVGEHMCRKKPNIRTIEVSDEQYEKCLQMGKEEYEID